jgi:hypothetical protein
VSVRSLRWKPGLLCAFVIVCCVLSGCEEFWNNREFGIRDTGWDIVGAPAIADSVYGQTLLVADGIPVLVYAVYYGEETTLMVAEFRDDAWRQAAPPRVTIRSNTVVEVDPASGKVCLADTADEASTQLYRLEENEWVSFGPPLEYSGHPESMVISTDGDIFVKLFDGVVGWSICRLSGSTWTLLGGEGAFPGYASSLTVSAGGDLFFGTENDATSWKPTVYRWNGSGWIVVGSELAELSGIDLEMAASPSGELYIIFHDGAVDHRLIARHWDGATWETLGSASGISTGLASYGRITIGQGGTVYVFFVDEGLDGEATVLRLSGSDWVPVGTEGFTYGDSADNLSITTLQDDTPIVTYVAGGHGRFLTAMKKRPE